jgi:hypothetical protein
MNIESNDEVLLKSLLNFYENSNKEQNLLKILGAISGQKTIISLREMDFVVTKYSKRFKINYLLRKDNTQFNLYLEYKAQLRGHSKKRFDPFCRIGDKKDSTRLGRFFINYENHEIEYLYGKTKKELDEYKKRTDGVVTNVGQMNFFKWAITNEVVDFCFKNKDNIIKEMDNEYKIKKSKKSKKINKKIIK